MRLLSTQRNAGPVFKIRAQPTARRLFSVGACSSGFCGWAYEVDGLERLFDVPPRHSPVASERGDFALETDDVFFHPTERCVAVVGPGRVLDIYDIADGSLVRTLDLDYAARACDVSEVGPHLHGGFFGHVVISGDGKLVAAGSKHIYKCEVFDFQSLTHRGTFFGCDSCFASHPDGTTVATVRNDQGGATIRFIHLEEPFIGVREDFGWGSPRIRISEAEDQYGWEDVHILRVRGMAFSQSGGMLAAVGGDPWESVEVCLYEFPSLVLLSSWRFSLPDSLREFSKYPSVLIERVAFDPISGRLFVPGVDGSVHGYDLTERQRATTWQAHRKITTSIDIDTRCRRLFTSSLNGEISMWALDG